MARSGGVGARIASTVVAVVLVAAAIGLARSGGVGEGIRRFIVAPFVFVTSPVGRAVRGLWGVGSVWSENRSLKTEVARLHVLETSAPILMAENLRYRELLGFQERSAFRMVAAHVIARSADCDGGDVVLDAGTSRGLAPGQTVISLTGLAGRVVRADSHQAIVRTLGSEDSPVSVYDERSRETGIVAWRAGTTPRFMLDDVPARADVQIGDMLLSTGYGGRFPRGIRVGRVTRVGIEARGLVKSVDVDPATPFGRLTDLMVLIDTVPPSDSLTSLWLDRFAAPSAIDPRRVVPEP